MSLKKKGEYLIFIILIFFQNFAILKTKSFGINALATYMIIISIIYFKKYYRTFNKKWFYSSLAIIYVIFFGMILNDCLNILQFFRYIMILWLIYIVYHYIRNVYEENNQNEFWGIYYFVFICILIYGIYEFFAIKYHLPLFLNVFSNNPSYAVRNIFDYYEGWINRGRLYNVFFEPSVYSVFLCLNFFLLMHNNHVNNKMKCFTSLLNLFNLYYTYARTRLDYVYLYDGDIHSIFCNQK